MRYGYVSEDAGVPSMGLEERLTLRELVEHFERDLILTALVASGGSQKLAAQALGVLPTTLSEKLKRLNHHAALKPGSLVRRNGQAAFAAGLRGGPSLESPSTTQKEKK